MKECTARCAWETVMEIFLIYFPSNRCLWAYGLPGRAWQLINKENRARTQAVWKLLFFGAHSLKLFIWTSASLRDIVMLFTTATKSYRKHYCLLPTSHTPPSKVCHYRCVPQHLLLAFTVLPHKNGNVLQGNIMESRPVISDCFWSNNLCNLIVVSGFERDLKQGAREYLQVVCNYPDIVRALLGIKLKRLNYKNSFGVLCSADDQLQEGVEFWVVPRAGLETLLFQSFFLPQPLWKFRGNNEDY